MQIPITSGTTSMMVPVGEDMAGNPIWIRQQDLPRLPNFDHYMNNVM